MGQHRTIIRTIDFGELGEKEVDFCVIYYAGSPPSGMWGPPENYDPGVGSELEIIEAMIDGHKILWMFDIEPLQLINEDICTQLDEEEPEFNEPERECAE